MRFHALGERLHVVAAFEDADHAAGGVDVGDFANDSRQLGEVFRLQAERADRVSAWLSKPALMSTSCGLTRAAKFSNWR